MVSKRISHRLGFIFVLGWLGLLASCTSARMSDRETDRLFRNGQYDAAVARLKKGLAEQGEKGKDTLLYLLDLGLSLHTQGKYDESNEFFLRADKVAEIKDYTSLAAETATLITSDNLKDYPGEDFENVLISTYLAMNYALMGNFEDALVEARRVNHKLEKMVTEGKRKYKQNAFARYLSAILYEAEQDFNDAYIDYQKVKELVPEFPGLGQDLWRCAWKMGMPDEMEKWDEVFHLTSEDHQQAKALEVKPKKKGDQKKGEEKKGEIIVLYENGIAPQKFPNPQFSQLPKFYPRWNPIRGAQIAINGEVKGETSLLEDVEATAIKNLDEKYGKMMAKKIAGVVAKEALAYGISQKTDNPLLGLLARVVMYASDQADLRSWQLLPRDLQIFRLGVEAGSYSVEARPIGVALPLQPKMIQVGAGKKVFVAFRYMP